MAQRSSIPELRHRIDERFDAAQPRQQEVPAILGNGQGTDLEHVRIDNTHSWARVGNTLMEVYNKRVPHIAETLVWLGYHPDDPGLFQVLRARETYLDRGYPMTPEHGVSHGWFPEGGGHDPTYTDIRQWTPLRVYPVGGNLSVKISQMPKIWRGSWLTVDEQTLDLTAHLPAEGARYVLITINATGVMTATAGTAVGDIFALQDSDIPTPPAGHFPLAAVRMYDTQTEIIEQRDNTDIVDLRFPPYATMAPASGTGGVAWENVIIVALSGGDYALNQSALTASVSGDLILTAPATYAETLIHKNGVYIRGMGPTGSVHVAPAAGIPLTLPASGGCVVENIVLDPPAGSVGLSYPAASTCNLALREVEVGTNGAASVGASTADATAILTAANCTFNGDLSIKCVTTLYDCQMLGAVTQAASAGALTIYGGRIVGNLTTVAGSTISLHDLPTILGTVSGAGTIIGAYLNSSGHIVFVNGTAASGFANPSGLIGMTAVNGVATTMQRSDSRNAIDAGIAPTWTGLHTFDGSLNTPVGDAYRVAGHSALDSTGSATTDHLQINLGTIGGAFDVIDIYAGTILAVQVDSATIFVGPGTAVNLDISVGDLKLANTTRISNAGAATFTNVTDSALTSGRVVLASTGGLLADDTDLEFDGLNLIIGPSVTKATGRSHILLDDGSAITQTSSGATAALNLTSNAWHDGTNWRRLVARVGAQVVQFTGTALDYYEATDAGNTVDSTITFTKRWGIATGGLETVWSLDSGTNNQIASLTLDRQSTGTPAANFGVNFLINLESATVASRNASAIQTLWVTATDASRAARMLLFAADSGGYREGMRIEASGSAGMIGFLGASASVRAAITGSRGGNAALANLLTELATKGLITDSTTV